VIGAGPYACLQGVAWAGMLRDYSTRGSLVLAIVKTFDGSHPCALCNKLAQEKRTAEKSPLALKADKKSVKFVTGAIAGVTPPIAKDFVFSPERSTSFAEYRAAPPSPVPRSA